MIGIKSPTCSELFDEFNSAFSGRFPVIEVGSGRRSLIVLLDQSRCIHKNETMVRYGDALVEGPEVRYVALARKRGEPP